MLEKNKNKIFILLVLLFIQILVFFLGETKFTTYLVSILLIIITVLLVLRSIIKRNNLLLIVFLFIGSYSFIPFTYYIFNQYFSFYTQCYESSLVFFSVKLLLLFYSFFYYFLNIQKKQIDKVNYHKPNTIGYIVSIIFLGILTLFSTGNTLLSDSNYSSLVTESVKAILPLEYSLLFILLSYVYSSNKIQKYFIYILTLIFCVKYFLFGGRVAIIEVFLLFFILKFQYKLTIRSTIFYSFLLFLLIMLWGVFRSGSSLASLSINYNSANAGEVYYSSIRILYLIENNILTGYDRMLSFIYYSLSPISVVVQDISPLNNLSTYLKIDYPSGGGGLGPIYYYAFLSYPGVVILSFISGKIFTNITKFKSINIKAIYTILAVVFVPRWFAYYPSQLIKLCVYGVILYVIFNSLKQLRPTELILKR